MIDMPTTTMPGAVCCGVLDGQHFAITISAMGPVAWVWAPGGPGWQRAEDDARGTRMKFLAFWEETGRPAVASDPCRTCIEILKADASRHFKECPRRAEHPIPNPLTIYVAGSGEERLEIQRHIGVVAEYGYTVTLDWTRHAGWGMPDASLTEDVLAGAARADLDAVRAAAVVWYLAPSGGKSEGSAVELGAALALGKEVVVSGPIGRHRIFPRLATHRFALHAEALDFLRERAKRLTCEA